MAKGSLWLALGVGAWVVAGLVTGCNAALGIDEAAPHDGEGKGGTGAISIPGPRPDQSSCTAPVTPCSSCIATACTTHDEVNAVSACLANAICRTRLDGYAACLGSTCGASQNDCFEHLYDTSGDIPIPDCIIAKCNNACATTPLYSRCQLYCACMGANCNGKFSDGTFATQDDCVVKCTQLELQSPDLVACRRTHCEIAGLYPDPKEQHCEHATGTTFCSTPTATMTTGSAGCHKSLNSFACLEDQDCCSGFCNSQRACEPK